MAQPGRAAPARRLRRGPRRPRVPGRLGRTRLAGPRRRRGLRLLPGRLPPRPRRPAGRGLEGLGAGPVGAPVQPGIPPLPRRSPVGVRRHRGARRGGAVRPVPAPARPVLAGRMDGLPGLVGGAPAATRIAAGATMSRHGRRRPAGSSGVPPVGSVAIAVGVAALVVLGSSLLSGCTLDQTGPPAAQLSAWMTTSGAGAAIGTGGGGQPQHRPGHLPPQHRRPCCGRCAPCSPPTPRRPSATCPPRTPS